MICTTPIALVAYEEDGDGLVETWGVNLAADCVPFPRLRPWL